ncbi:MAG: hypothetical protein HYR60_16225 [Acidobacteria bacterium]|nr:hypothetical protein [Acidobacteriota bacterium]
MHRLTLLLPLAAALSAQDPASLFEKAPPHLDQALRERVAAFYQAHVDGKFRLAEALVAEDTKDFYFEAGKPRYLSFAIDRILYSDNFTRAKVVMLCEQRVMMPGFSDTPMKVPTPSTWKLENGKWYWWVDQAKGRETPFGVMKPGTAAGGGGIPSSGALASLDVIAGKVKADRKGVQLPPGATEKVVFSSEAPGAVTLSLDAFRAPDLEIALDRNELKPGEHVTLTLHSKLEKPAAMGLILQVRVQPFNLVIPVQVVF